MKNVKSIEIKCPICQAVNTINVPESILAQKKFGSLKIEIPLGAVCSEHQFIVFLDPNGVVRGYEKIDMQMRNFTEKLEMEENGTYNLQVLIKTFGTVGFLSIIHSKVFGYPTFIIANENLGITEEVLNKIGDSILPEEYQGFKTIHFLQESDFGGIIDQINVGRDTFLMDSQRHILQTPWDVSLKWEQEILERMLDILNKEDQLLILQYAISKFINEAKEAKNILELIEDIREKDLKKKISSLQNTSKISSLHFKLIKEFIERRFSPNLILKIK